MDSIFLKWIAEAESVVNGEETVSSLLLLFWFIWMSSKLSWRSTSIRFSRQRTKKNPLGDGRGKNPRLLNDYCRKLNMPEIFRVHMIVPEPFLLRLIDYDYVMINNWSSLSIMMIYDVDDVIILLFSLSFRAKESFYQISIFFFLHFPIFSRVADNNIRIDSRKNSLLIFSRRFSVGDWS